MFINTKKKMLKEIAFIGGICTFFSFLKHFCLFPLKFKATGMITPHQKDGLKTGEVAPGPQF